jgi:hypothetical protein
VLVGLVLIQWIAAAIFIGRHPAWFLRLWGPDMTWARLESMVLQVLFLFRLIVSAFLVLVIWASFWSAALSHRVRVTGGAELTTPVPIH